MSTQSASLTSIEFPITDWLNGHYLNLKFRYALAGPACNPSLTETVIKDLANRTDMELGNHRNQFTNIEKRLEKTENDLAAETENRAREERWLKAQLIEVRSETAAISERVTSAVDRISRTEQKPQDVSTQSQRAILEELEQQKRENARLHQQYREQITGLERKFAKRERKHAEEIQELKMIVMQLAASQGGHKQTTSSLESAKDLEFQSPVNSDSDDFFG